MSADCLLGAPIADLLILTSISYFLCFYLSVGTVMMSVLSLSELVLTVSFLPISVWRNLLISIWTELNISSSPVSVWQVFICYLSGVFHSAGLSMFGSTQRLLASVSLMGLISVCLEHQSLICLFLPFLFYQCLFGETYWYLSQLNLIF